MAIWEQPELLSGNVNTSNIGDNKPEIAIGILHTGEVTMEWAMRTSLVFMHCQTIKKNFIYLCGKNAPYDVSRETIARQAIESGCKYLFFLDSDVLIPVNTIEVLIDWSKKFNAPVMSGLYWAKKPGPKMPAAWLKVDEHPESNTYDFLPVDVMPHLNTQNIIPVDVVGAGCLLINVDILRKLDKSNPNLPFFQWGVGRRDAQGKNLLNMSEDFYFCVRCFNELGIKPALALGVKCDHLGIFMKRGTDGEIELSMRI